MEKKGGDEYWGTDIILPGNEASIQFNDTGNFWPMIKDSSMYRFVFSEKIMKRRN